MQLHNQLDDIEYKIDYNIDYTHRPNDNFNEFYSDWITQLGKIKCDS